MARQIKAAPAAAATALALSVAACGHNPMNSSTYSWGPRHYANLSERDCMARAMYFESNRSSQEGMKAVGTVVMNRVKSGQYSGNICGVVGAPRQFAPGVLSKPVSGSSWALAQRSADAIIAGERHARVGRAMHFHTAGYTFPYRNMAYVVAAGGNVFYEKKTPGTFNPVHPNVLVAEARNRPERPSERIVLAQAKPIAPRVEPVRLASVEEREPLRAVRSPVERRQILARLEDDAPPARAGHGRRQFAQQAEEATRQRAKPERIRLAHLDDDDMPKALRQRSDATPSGRLGSIALPYKNAALEPTKAQPSKPAAAAPPSRKPSPTVVMPARPGAKQEPAGRTALAAPVAVKPRGEALPYRDAKAKPGADALAKAGWHRGPEPVAKSGTPDKPKKKS